MTPPDVTTTERPVGEDEPVPVTPATSPRDRGVPTWVAFLAPLLLIVAAIGAFAAAGGPGLGERTGPPVEELAIEKTVLKPGTIALTVRNDGPDGVLISQAIVNDAVAQFTGGEEPIGRLQTATLTISQPWVEGEAYEVALLTGSGGTVVHEVPVAVLTPDSDAGFFGLMSLIGVYVGVIPVALGMLWLPFIRRIPAGWLRGVMALTVGLLGPVLTNVSPAAIRASRRPRCRFVLTDLSPAAIWRPGHRQSPASRDASRLLAEAGCSWP